MAETKTSERLRIFTLAFCLFGLVTLGCTTQRPVSQPPPTPPPVQLDPRTTSERVACEKLAVEKTALADENVQHETTIKNLEDQVRTLNLRLYEHETLNAELQKQKATWQSRLDEAIQEVVRAKGKLRSLESKAEAASNLAETEVAVKAYKAQRKNGDMEQESIRADQLLTMAGEEFRQGNYAGALYLASEARTRLRPSEPGSAPSHPAELLPGEELFAIELPFVLREASRLREGPGLDFRALTTMPKGSSVVGVSKKSQWIRVKTKDGASGWVFDALITRP